MNRSRLLRILITLVAFASLVEGGARIWLSRLASEEQFAQFAPYSELTNRYGVPPLDIHRTLAYTGVASVERGASQHNSLGFRGPEIEMPKPDGVFRIVAIGGSATYGAAVADDRATYPAQLAAELEQRGHETVEVINAGVREYSSWEDLFNFQFRVLDLQPDLVLVQAGYEDIAARLVLPSSAYRGDNSGYLLPPMPFEPPWWERSVALRIAGVLAGSAELYYDLTVKWRLRAPTACDLMLLEQIRLGMYPTGVFLITPVEEILADNPPVYFANNMQSLALAAQVNSVPLVFITTPGEGLFLSNTAVSAAYQSALEEHNVILRELATSSGTGLFELAALLTGQPAYFADETNLTEAGNTQFAQLLADFLENGRWLP